MQFLKALVGTCCFTRKQLSNEPGLKSWLGKGTVQLDLPTVVDKGGREMGMGFIFLLTI